MALAVKAPNAPFGTSARVDNGTRVILRTVVTPSLPAGAKVIVRYPWQEGFQRFAACQFNSCQYWLEYQDGTLAIHASVVSAANEELAKSASVTVVWAKRATPVCRRPSKRRPASVADRPFKGLCVSYEMPARFGLDENPKDGLIDFLTVKDGAKIAPATWPVELTVDGGRCDGKATYTWTIDGKDAKHTPKSKCTFTLDFPKEATYRVEVTAKKTGQPDETASKEVVVQDFLIVGIGDSLAAGEGVPDRMAPAAGQPATWQDPQCHRSRSSWQAKAALTVEDLRKDVGDKETSVTFVHIGCSGATIEHLLRAGYLGIEPGVALEAQVKAFKDLLNNREVDALLLSVGINDFRFGDVARFCVENFTCQEDDFEGVTLARWIAARMGELPARYDRLSAALALKPAVKADRIYITQYPDFLHQAAGVFCPTILEDAEWRTELGANIGAAESEWLFNNLLVPLNTQIASRAPKKWKLIDGIPALFLGHGYCAPDAQRWIVRHAESLRNQGNENGPLHPNEMGQSRIARLAEKILKNDLYPGGFTRKP